MAQHNTLNATLSNSQLNKLKSEIKSGTKVTWNRSPNLIKNFDDETHFPNELLLTDTQVTAFEDLKSFYRWFIK